MLRICSFYKFHQIDDVERVRDLLFERGQALDLRGLILVAPEGANATFSGRAEAVQEFCSYLERILGIAGKISYKNSSHPEHPFRRWKVDQRQEIITFSGPLVPTELAEGTHLSPAQWDQMRSADPNCVTIDTRNRYETKLGKFNGAVDPDIATFTEFLPVIDRLEAEKDKTYLLYCTGGVRCEKVVVEMKQRGFNKVFQLAGGILNYFKESKRQDFAGECFVFDHRVALDQRCQSTGRFGLCPHCGDPAAQSIDCGYCGKQALLCDQCVEHRSIRGCSKNCEYHLKGGSKDLRHSKSVNGVAQQPPQG